MKKNQFTLILLLFVFNTITGKDTLNVIEIGRVFTSLFNNAGLKYGYDLNNTTFAYTRLTKSRKVFFKAEYHYYKQYNQFNINLYKVLIETLDLLISNNFILEKLFCQMFFFIIFNI